MPTNIKIKTHVVKQLPTERPLEKGAVYKVEQPNGDLLTYTIDSSGNPVLERGITNEQNARLERMSSEQISKVESITTGDITKLKEDYTKAEIDQQFEDVRNLANSSRINLNGSTVLPVPPRRPDNTIIEDAWVRLAQNVTYTQSGGDPLTGIDGHETVAEWNNEDGEWVLVDMGELPVNPADGLIFPDDTRPISGGEVYKTLGDVIGIPVVNFLDFSLSAGQISPATGTSNGSVNWISTEEIPCTNQLYTIVGFGDSSSTLRQSRIVCININGNVVQVFDSTGNSEYFSFTPPATAVHFRVNIESSAGVGSDIPNSPYWELFKVYEGSFVQNVNPYIKADKILGEINTPQIRDVEEVVNSIEPLINKNYDPQSLLLADGAINISGVSVSNPSYRRTSVSNPASMASYNANLEYTYSGEINVSGSFAGVSYRDESFQQIGFDCSDAGVYDNYILTPPEGTRYIATCSYQTDPIINILTTSLKTSSSAIMYVDLNYSGESNGSIQSPFTSINEAIYSVGSSSSSIIIVSEGDYRETLDLEYYSTGHHQILSREGHKVRVLGSNQITGFTKTLGYNNIYQAPFEGSIPEWSRSPNIIYEDGRNSRPIPVDENHPYHKNLTHRLPFTPIREVDDLGLLDVTVSSYCHIDGVLYIHTSNSDDPNENEYNYEIPTIAANTINNASSTNKKVDLNISNIQFFYNTSGVRLAGFGSSLLTNVVSLGTNSAGAIRPDTGFNTLIGCEAGYCNGDGFNGHFSSYTGYASLLDNRSNYPTTRYIDCWSHDNFDDGESSHEHHNVLINGVLFENNGDSGCRPSNDSTYFVRNGIFRNNGWHVGLGGSPGKGEGFATVNASSGGSRVGCRATLFDCISYGNNTGYGTISSSENYIELINCVSRNNFTAEYYAGLGTMVLRNCKGTNEDELKLKVVDSGLIQVFNDNIVS